VFGATFEWATETPEPSPRSWTKVPTKTANEQVYALKKACDPIFEQLFACIASHVDVLENAETPVRFQMVQGLCQPFFDHISGALCDEVSSVGFCPFPEVVQTVAKSRALDKPRLNLEQSLALWEEGSTDTDDGSAFAGLFSSDGEEHEVESRKETPTAAQLMLLSATPISSREDDVESLQDATVCKHWKSRGWCRYHSQCKFLHPEDKRGISVSGPADLSRSAARRGRKVKAAKVQTEVPGRYAVPLASTSFPWSYSACAPR
jgi:hypothetical protein